MYVSFTIYVYSDSDEEIPFGNTSAGGGVAVARPSTSGLNNICMKKNLSSSAITLSSQSPALRRNGSLLNHPQCGTEAPFDLLGDILKGQNLLLSDSSTVKIHRDGRYLKLIFRRTLCSENTWLVIWPNVAVPTSSK